MVAGVVLCAVATPAPARVPAPAPDLTPVLAGVKESAAAHQESEAPAHRAAPPAPPVVAPPQSHPRSRLVRAAGRTGRAVLEAARDSTRLR